MLNNVLFYFYIDISITKDVGIIVNYPISRWFIRGYP